SRSGGAGPPVRRSLATRRSAATWRRISGRSGWADGSSTSRVISASWRSSGDCLIPIAGVDHRRSWGADLGVIRGAPHASFDAFRDGRIPSNSYENSLNLGWNTPPGSLRLSRYRHLVGAGRE